MIDKVAIGGPPKERKCKNKHRPVVGQPLQSAVFAEGGLELDERRGNLGGAEHLNRNTNPNTAWGKQQASRQDWWGVEKQTNTRGVGI